MKSATMENMLGLLTVLSFTSTLSLAGSHKAHNRNHDALAKRVAGSVALDKRYSNSRWSWYDAQTGQAGACGQMLSNSDWIVALNTPQFGSGYPGPHCFETVTLNFNGKTATARIMDKCPGCPWGGLDLSPSLFQYFDGLGTGIIHGEWHFGTGGGGAPAPVVTTTQPVWTPPPQPTTTSTPPPPPPTTTPTPEPTTTWTPEPEPTTTWTPEPEPTTSAEPEPATPEPTTAAEPEPTTVAEPEPTTVAEPEPTTTWTPEPTTEPEPTTLAEPEPTTTWTPEPLAVPETTSIVEPEPTTTWTPEPLAVTEPTVEPETTWTPPTTTTPTPDVTPTPTPTESSTASETPSASATPALTLEEEVAVILSINEVLVALGNVAVDGAALAPEPFVETDTGDISESQDGEEPVAIVDGQ